MNGVLNIELQIPLPEKVRAAEMRMLPSSGHIFKQHRLIFAPK